MCRSTLLYAFFLLSGTALFGVLPTGPGPKVLVFNALTFESSDGSSSESEDSSNENAFGETSVESEEGEALNFELLMAARGMDAGYVAELLQHGADPLVTDDEGFLPLHYALTSEIALLLVQAAPETINHRHNTSGSTPLHRAARRGNYSVVNTLLECGANAQQQDRHHRTPAQLALNEDVRRLIENFGRKSTPCKRVAL